MKVKIDRVPLLTNDTWRALLSQAMDRAMERHHWGLTAFVYMPEHVHLLVFPIRADATDMDKVLKAIKRPYSYRIKRLLVATSSGKFDRLHP